MTPSARIDRQLGELIEQLRGAGWNIGLQQHVDAQHLLINGRLPDDPQQLQWMLSALLCCNRREQEEFTRYFRPWVGQFLTRAAPTFEPAAAVPTATPAVRPPPETPPQIPWRERLQGFLAQLKRLRSHLWPLLGALLALTAAWLIPNWGAPLLALAGLSLLYPAYRFIRAFWDAFLTRHPKEGLLQAESFRIEAPDGRTLFHDPALSRSAQRLRRHVEQGRLRLDPRATVRRSLRAGNWFTPVYRRPKRVPEYLALIDRQGFQDHRSHLIDALLERLDRDEGLALDRYFFSGDPRHCYPAGNQLRGRGLDELMEAHPHHRLLIFGDGSGLFDRVSGEPAEWIEQLHRWGQPVLFVPALEEAWQVREERLLEQGFLVFSADRAGFAAFAAALDDPNVRVEPGGYLTPPQLLTRRVRLWLSQQPPDDAQQEALIRTLQGYLNPDGFQWLVACAIFPELHWPLTLAIGQGLKVADLAEQLRHLAVLPWFRHGFMPDWLREELLDSVPKKSERALRKLVEEILERDSERGLRLDYVDPATIAHLPGGDATRGDALFLEGRGGPRSVRVRRLRKRYRRWWRQTLEQAQSRLQRLQANLLDRWRHWYDGLMDRLQRQKTRMVERVREGRFPLRKRPAPKIADQAVPAMDEGATDGQDSAKRPAFLAFRDPLQSGGQGPEMVSLQNTPLCFRMGSPEDEPGRWGDREGPVHEVTLSPFAVGRYPVTVGEFRRFVEATGYRTEAETGDGAYVRDAEEWKTKADANWRNPSFEQGDDHPAVCISWNDAQAYCEWLSKQTGETYRLLTEAEWEYACRAGSQTRYCFGDDEAQLGDHAWYTDNAENRTHPVGQKLPNAFGLHDLHGNAWEWVKDWFDSDYYKSSPPEDPSGPENGSARVIRGGGWNDSARYCRSAFRVGLDPAYRDGFLGFRLARTNPLPSYPFTPEEKPQPGLCDYLSDGKTPAASMVWLPGGSFLMGSPETEEGRYDDEGPRHEVTLEGFSVGQYPVTVRDFARFVAATGYQTEAERGDGAHVRLNGEWVKKKDAHWRNPYFDQTDENPVVCISWNDAKAYCDWVSRETGERYGLLTEAQWEYACRAGTATPYSFGEDASRLGEHAWYDENAEGRTHPVGEKPPHPWGLYDLHGNVWEWVEDAWQDNYKDAPADGSARQGGSNRVIRGGSWNYSARDCRSAVRHRYGPADRSGYLGFRLARLGRPLHFYPVTLGRDEAGEETKGPEFLPYQAFRDGGEAPEMVYLPGGEFRMGDESQGPVHQVTLSPFAAGKYPVTVGEYMRFVRETDTHRPEWLEAGSKYHVHTGKDAHYKKIGDALCDEACPVVGISWDDAQAYSAWLSEKTGKEYRLLTEAEWEYACRGGSEEAYCFGKDEKELDAYAWFDENAEGRPHPVGEKKANAYGLYDMHGNVWEWVRDWYGGYSKEDQEDPQGPEQGSSRVIRGGSWYDSARDCRSAVRDWNGPASRYDGLGFRLARTIP